MLHNTFVLFRSFEGVGLQLLATPTRAAINSDSSRICSTKSIMNSAQKFKAGTSGLNEVKNLTTPASRIRNPSLRKYYGEEDVPIGDEFCSGSVVRRSPRIAGLI